MSIAELIMTGTNRASESTAWVGDSLAKLGQQVGASLAQREQQKQAQEMLPFLQQSMQESMTLAGSGKTGEAYSKLMPFLTDPSVARNPFMMPALEAGIKMNQIAADDYLRKSQIEAYNARSTGSGGGGEGGGGFDIQGYVDVLNQGGDATQQEEQVVDQTEVNPMVAGQLPGMRIPAPQNQAGMAAEKNAIDQQAEDQLPTLSQGPTKEAEKAMGGVLPDLQKEPPPKNILEKFIKIEDRFAKLPLDKQRAEMDNTSIIFPNKEDVAAYKSPKGRGVVELSTAAGVGVPGAVAVELPQAVSKYVLSGVNVNPKTGNVSYSINQKEIDKDPNAKSAISWLRDWQEASVKVSNNPQLRDLLAQANNDALEIDIKPLGKNATTPEGEVIEGDIAELTVKGKPETKIQVPADVAKNIEMLQTQTAAANTHNAKFIRLKGEEPAPTEAPAPTQGGLPATQPQPAVEVPEEAMELQKIVEQGKAAKAKETEKNVDKRIQDIDIQIKRLASPTTIAYDQAGLIAVERPIRKTPEEAQADIQKIAKLKAEKDALQGKPSNQKEIKEGDIVVQNKKRYKFTNGKPVLIN